MRYMTEAQIAFGKKLNLDLTNKSLGEAEAMISDVIRREFHGVADCGSPTPKQIELAAKFQRDDMIERFLRSGRSGFYFSVEQEGSVAVEDDFQVLKRNDPGITIAEMNHLFVRDKYNHGLLRKAIQTSSLPEDWRDYFQERLDRPSVAM